MHHLTKSDHDDTTLAVLEASILNSQVAPASGAKYMQAFRRYVTFAGSVATALDPATFARWRVYLVDDTCHPAHTINNWLTGVRQVVVAAAAHGHLSVPCAHQFQDVPGVVVHTMDEGRRPQARPLVTPEHVRQMIDAPLTLCDCKPHLIKLRNAALLATLAGSTLDRHGVATLRYTQIERCETAHPRTGATVLTYVLWVADAATTDPHPVPLNADAYERITAWRHAHTVDSPYIFLSFVGRRRDPQPQPAPLSDVAVWRIIHYYATALGMPHIKPYDLQLAGVEH